LRRTGDDYGRSNVPNQTKKSLVVLHSSQYIKGWPSSPSIIRFATGAKPVRDTHRREKKKGKKKKENEIVCAGLMNQ
jgi:hypothetical protein